MALSASGCMTDTEYIKNCLLTNFCPVCLAALKKIETFSVQCAKLFTYKDNNWLTKENNLRCYSKSQCNISSTSFFFKINKHTNNSNVQSSRSM